MFKQQCRVPDPCHGGCIRATWQIVRLCHHGKAGLFNWISIPRQEFSGKTEHIQKSLVVTVSLGMLQVLLSGSNYGEKE